ncbi:hypothetical protein [Nocardioides sp. P86]|uniref:hypothetical protein n=1 Tax=Nocardioides sp. P86 TaxID=2939569 RepID=UPI00203DBD11|nr:hypothetical protein [Nocardioides sp. P86]MCM3517162.1 hypothetical protein [Nocardioides sp. P86]
MRVTVVGDPVAGAAAGEPAAESAAESAAEPAAEHTVEVPAATTLAALLPQVVPAVVPPVAAGGADVVLLLRHGGDWLGMHSATTGTRVLRDPERTVAELDPPRVRLEPWPGVDGSLLLEELALGRLPDRAALAGGAGDGWRRRWEAEERELGTVDGAARLLDADVVEALAAVGATVLAHGPGHARVEDAAGSSYVVRCDRQGGAVSRLDADGLERPVAAVATRPDAGAGAGGPTARRALAATLAALLGATWREQRGLEPAPPPAPTRDTRVEVARGGGVWGWSWSDAAGRHEGRFAADGAMAAATAAYARLEPADVVAHLTAPAADGGGDPSRP